MMRLDKYLSERLGIPRGESRKLAAKGRVTVNGVLTKKADTQWMLPLWRCWAWVWPVRRWQPPLRCIFPG